MDCIERLRIKREVFETVVGILKTTRKRETIRILENHIKGLSYIIDGWDEYEKGKLQKD